MRVVNIDKAQKIVLKLTDSLYADGVIFMLTKHEYHELIGRKISSDPTTLIVEFEE